MYDARLRDSLPRVEERIGQALQRTGGRTAVRIVAVTKGHPVAAVRAAIAAGLQDLGENRVNELEAKIDEVGRNAARWHLIGHLQRNKVKKALGLVDLVHSVDSLRLAQEVSREACEAGITAQALVQVNASGEATKGGIDVTHDLTEPLDAVGAILGLPNLAVRGLMTMAPFVADKVMLRSCFERTRRLLDACARQFPALVGRELSMGMTNDFEIAVEEGSTMVRLGTILFGERAT